MENVSVLQAKVAGVANNIGGRRVLVTGSAGFVGAKIVERLAANGIPVLATDTRGCPHFYYAGPMVEFRRADLTDKDSLAVLFKDCTINFILHPAAVFKFSAPPELLQLVNVKGTENLLDVATSLSRIEACVVFSSAMVYGERRRVKPITEELEPKPTNPYARSKLDEEKAALQFSGKCKVIIFRPSAIYGRGSNYGLRKIIDVLANDYPALPLPFMGETENNVANIRDVACASIHLLSNYESLQHAFFNIADSVPMKLKDTFRLIKELLHSKTTAFPLPGPVSEVLNFFLGMAPSTMELPLHHPFTRRLITRLEPDDFLAIFNENVFSNARLLETGYTLYYPSLEQGIRATIDHCVFYNELPRKTIERIGAAGKRRR